MKLDEYWDKIQGSSLMYRAYSLAQRLGIIFEKFVFAILCGLFPKKKGYRIFHVDWSDYTSSMGKGLDLKLFQRNKLLAVFEVKNWAKKGRPYGTETATEQILSRFKNCGTNLKILIISFKSLLTKRALALLEANNVFVLETKKLIGKNDFPRKHKYSKAFYQLRAKIYKLINAKQARKDFFGCSCVNSKQVRLDKIDINDNTTNTKPNKQYDSDSKKLAREYAMTLVKRAIKLGQPKHFQSNG